MAETDIVAVVEYYGGEVNTTRAGWTKIRCPFHDDRMPSATINVAEGVFKCWAGCVAGDGFAVVMWREGLDFPSSQRFIQDTIGASVRGISEAASGRPPGSRVLESPGDNRAQRGIFQIGVRRGALPGA